MTTPEKLREEAAALRRAAEVLIAKAQELERQAMMSAGMYTSGW